MSFSLIMCSLLEIGQSMIKCQLVSLFVCTFEVCLAYSFSTLENLKTLKNWLSEYYIGSPDEAITLGIFPRGVYLLNLNHVFSQQISPVVPLEILIMLFAICFSIFFFLNIHVSSSNYISGECIKQNEPLFLNFARILQKLVANVYFVATRNGNIALTMVIVLLQF